MILSIIVPVYNELQSLPQVLDNLLALPRPEGLGLQVIVINDGSTDGSGQFLRDFPLLPQLKVVHLDQNQGKGAAVRVGLVRAEGDIVAIQDADLEYSPHHLLELIEPIRRGQVEVVYGSRFLGRAQGMVWTQKLANQILCLWTNLLYGCHLSDPYTGYKIFSGRVARLLSESLVSRGFELEAEITARLLGEGLMPLELPILYTARSRMEGKKIRPRDGLLGLLRLLQMRLQRSSLRPENSAR